MKKLFYLLGVLLVSCTLAACSNGSKQNSQTVDNDFITLVSKGLEKRSSMISEANDTKVLLEAIKFEEDNLKVIEGKEFQNPELKALYEKYIEQLNIQEKNYMYFSDYSNYDKRKVFMDAYNERSKIIATLIDKYGLKLDQKLADEFKNNSAKVTSEEDLDNKLVESFSKAQFKREDTYTVRGNVKNETGETVTNKRIEFKFIGKDNVVVATSEYYIDGSWESDEVRNVEIFIETEQSFDKIEFKVSNF